MSTSVDINNVTAALVARVRALYEAHPYPQYPLLATPRWEDGYLAHSRLAQALAGTMPEAVSGRGGRAQILIGGSGEILPYIVRKWEPRSHGVISLDLSLHSLRRARLRLFATLKPASFVHSDLDHYLRTKTPGSLAHVDAYGVLHHMADPGTTLQLIAKALAPGGTSRLMVYNTTARTWIRHLQKAFTLLGLDPLKPADLQSARKLLALAAESSPSLSARIKQVGSSTIDNDARLADLFLHPREARLPIDRWLRFIEDAGMTVCGLVDRYGELDDLPNPLWQPPTWSQLSPRILDRRFEGNLELFLQRPGGKKMADMPIRAKSLGELSIGQGPALWWSFEETRTVARHRRRRIWQAHRAWLSRRERFLEARDINTLSSRALARLARLGAFLPGQLTGHAATIARAPLEQSMEAPDAYAAAGALSLTTIQAVERLLQAKGLGSSDRLAAILRRLESARK